MANLLNVFQDTNIESGVAGTELKSSVLAGLHASLVTDEKRFLRPVADAPFGLKMTAGTYIKLVAGGQHYIFGTDTEMVVRDAQTLLDAGAKFSPATDYYVYLCCANPAEINAQAKLVVSKNATYPSGYTSETSRKIGGFHTLCVSVGQIAHHPLSGLNAGEILPASVWCLRHRPVCAPEGMAYIEPLDFWADIYLQSGKYGSTVSAYGGTITDTQGWDEHTGDLIAVGKTLLSDAEFACAMEGSNQKTAISGASDPVTTGGHVDSAGRRMISNFGLEDGCGVMWQWLDHPSMNGSAGEWSDLPGGKGQLYGTSYAPLAGGFWYYGTHCGSRCRNANSVRAIANSALGGRGRARSL